MRGSQRSHHKSRCHGDLFGMRKVSGFALFAIKSHRVCSFSKNGTEGSIRQKAGLIPEYPSTDPRRAGGGGGETVILNPRELRKVITLQQTTKDQTIWMTTSQPGFPLERDVDEVTNIKDAQIQYVCARRSAATRIRYLHAISISLFPDM
jgi:hypothetical protein